MLLHNAYRFVVGFQICVINLCFTIIKPQFIYNSTLTPSKSTIQPNELNTKHECILTKLLPRFVQAVINIVVPERMKIKTNQFDICESHVHPILLKKVTRLHFLGKRNKLDKKMYIFKKIFYHSKKILNKKSCN